MAEVRKKPELLAPAGDWEKLQMAVLYGADAVYLAGTSFGMRSFTGNFTPEELPKAIQFAHEHGVRVHVTVNTMPRNDEAVALPAWDGRMQEQPAHVRWLIMLCLRHTPPPTSSLCSLIMPELPQKSKSKRPVFP